MKLFPLEGIQPRSYGLATLSWKRRKLVADFFHDDNYDLWIRVSFDRVEMIRILDEMPLCTEEVWQDAEGFVLGTFAYRVEDSVFWRSQSEAFRLSFHYVHHYQFVTSGDCLDVLSAMPPTISMVPSRLDEFPDDQDDGIDGSKA